MSDGLKIEMQTGEAGTGETQSALSIEEIAEIVKASCELGIRKYCIAGEEPLLRDDISELIANIKAIEGVEELELITNGLLLKDCAKELKEAGLDRISICVDTLRYMRFGERSSGESSLDDVVAGINEAVNAQLKPVKLIVKIMRGFNEDEILDFLQLTLQHEYEVRFAEVSPQEASTRGCEHVSAEEMKQKMPALRPMIKNGGAETATATTSEVQRYKYPGAKGSISFDTPVSGIEPGEREITLTADGGLKPHTASPELIDIKSCITDRAALKKALQAALATS